MLITYQYKLRPTPEQVSTMEVWGELLRRHYNYALGQRLDWLRRTRFDTLRPKGAEILRSKTQLALIRLLQPK